VTQHLHIEHQVEPQHSEQETGTGHDHRLHACESDSGSWYTPVLHLIRCRPERSRPG
jgi:hypothetical protein